ncbi:Abi-domain-containing protein [Piromyces finnis]|uniref:Abi-domain-containing protein n=1 Tax=Piromyces finnis TaxID=1754191 RepID=A0A1Y1V5R6_9FUNG|nr:Abi-domain-containing protein [Piromyces finnis]|eukprot:ORX47907.1 Abi-domain-containing protein [Piromyces finnis]
MEYKPIENKIDISDEEDSYSLDSENHNTTHNIVNNENTVIDINDNELLYEDNDSEIENAKKEKARIGFFKQFLIKKVYKTGLIGYISLVSFNIIYSVIFGSFLENIQNSNEEDINEMIKLHPVMMMTYACIFAPMIEEFVFRKLMFGFIKRYSKILAYIISCFFFAFGHFGFSFTILLNEIGFFPIYFIAAAILAYIYDYDGYILASMIAHMLYNSTMLVLGSLLEEEI